MALSIVHYAPGTRETPPHDGHLTAGVPRGTLKCVLHMPQATVTFPLSLLPPLEEEEDEEDAVEAEEDDEEDEDEDEDEDGPSDSVRAAS